MVMDGYYIDRLPELWRKIDSLHLSYLEMEDSPTKLEQKIKLDECIKEYLCIAPHNQKFCFKETAEVLHRSASSKKDFSGYRAVLGWNAIGMYAANLISQPWRQEYREIKMYSGYYKHQIESNLVGAEIMFEAMGYKHEGNGIMILEGPICPDRVTNVSRDALVACVECQILKEIWEDVTTSFKISWLDVLEFRETHLCSPKKSVDALRYQIQQRQYQEHQRSYSQGNNDYLQSNYQHPTMHMHVTSPTLPINHSFPPLSGHSHLPMPVAPIMPPQCIYNNGYYGSNYGTYAMIPAHYNYTSPATYAQTVMKQPHNGYCCNGYIPPNNPSYGCPVPTAQLIELEPPNLTVDVTDFHKSRKNSLPVNDTYIKNGASATNSNVTKVVVKDDSGQFENWDYVYRNLESQGYSKDLGERGDLLNSQYIVPQIERETKSKDFDLKVSDRPLKINEALEKYKEHDRIKQCEFAHVQHKNSDEILNSSYENLSLQDINTKKQIKVIPKTKVVTTDKIEDVEQKSKQYNKPTDVKKLKSVPSKGKTSTDKSKIVGNISKEVHSNNTEDAAVNNGNGNWQCKHCTYINKLSNKICEMCNKSKTVISNEMEIGGSECSKCTLVNSKDVKICVACNASLQNSPTYI